MAPKVVELAPGVWRIPLIGDFVNGFAFRDDDGQVTLLDMGVRASGKKVVAALGQIGADTSQVTRLLLTHCHPDHAGGAAYVARETGRPVDVHAADAAYVRDGTQPPRDPAHQPWLLRKLMKDPEGEPVTIGEELTDGQLLDVAGGLRVVHTPGHSPGHVSYLHEPTGVLVTGDAIFNVLGLRWPMKALCTDFVMTQQTAHRLAELEYAVAAFTHGPEIRERPRERIRGFLAKNG
jgi:glyoxylase-like metal-dependent hydrolase (beta-lactamase superfamily II)